MSEEGMATHSSILAWRIPWTEDSGGLQSIGSHRVGGAWRITAHGVRKSQTQLKWFSLEEQVQIKHQFSSVAQSLPTLCDPMNLSMPARPVHHQLQEFTYRVSDAIQPSHPLLFPSPPAPNPSQHQGLFQWVNSSHQVAKVLEFQPQHQSFQWTPRTGLL